MNDDDLRSWAAERELIEGNYNIARANRESHRPIQNPGDRSMKVVGIALILLATWFGLRDQIKSAPHRAAVKQGVNR